ncbi:MAG: potassium-transporting ATPase subunit KdpC [bacterium]|nr:potassium-transporting ATPase subunit KdpC [bacterium]
MKQLCKQSLLMLLVLTILTGILYPFLVTLVGQTAFSRQANGSILLENGVPIGSKLIGQSFTDHAYFWGRPSATESVPYNGASSSGSNLGPTNPALVSAVTQRIAALQVADSINVKPVPVDLVTMSGSGLDPHISYAAALYQLHRVAVSRNVPEDEIRRLLNRIAEDRQFGVLGEPRVNVLILNIALDRQFQVARTQSSRGSTTTKLRRFTRLVKT